MFQLEIEDTGENTLVRPASLDRTELSYRVVLADPGDAPAVLISELRGLPGHFGIDEREFFYTTGHPEDTHSGIVFVPTVNGHHGLEETLQEVRVVVPSAVGYAGGTTPGNKGWGGLEEGEATELREIQGEPGSRHGGQQGLWNGDR